jgi:glycine reductase
MLLELGKIKITDVQPGDATKVENGTLYVNTEELIDLALEDDRIKSVKIEFARPGESVRIAPVKDVIEPRVKVSGSGAMFPGMINKVKTVGSGRTRLSRG